MVNRINEILKRYNLSAAKFADKLDVPRSTISHILSERNKPSLEFIQKVLTKFPEISTNWLLKGEGNFYIKGEPDLFSQLDEVNTEDVETNRKDETNQNQKIKYQNENIPENKAEDDRRPKQGKYQNLSDIKSIGEQPETSENLKDEGITEQNKNINKKVIKIIVLYNDQTFEEFSSSQSNIF
ncbi:MAG: helix-turn-helix domain-containing protein [Bacteroidota bacterium]